VGHDANYIEERVLQPLQRAVAVMREAEGLEITIKQRQATIESFTRGEEELKRKAAEWQAVIKTAQAQATEQRQELQGQLRADRQLREAERKQFQQEREQLQEQQRTEQARLADVQRERHAAEEELASIKRDIAGRLQALKGVAS
jgi:chromosome segregation ATPase